MGGLNYNMDYISLILISCFGVLLWIHSRLNKIHSQTYKIQNKITELESEDITKEQERQVKENLSWEIRECNNEVKDLFNTVDSSKNIIFGVFIVCVVIFLILTRDERPDIKIDWFKILIFPIVVILYIGYSVISDKFRSKD